MDQDKLSELFDRDITISDNIDVEDKKAAPASDNTIGDLRRYSERSSQMISKSPGHGTDRLGADVARSISLFLNNKDFSNLSSVNKAWRQESIDKLNVRQLLEYVMDGEETKAKVLIKENPAILQQKATGRDPAGRTFENITAFQYALWALDWYMWEMMLPHMDTSEAREQYDALMSRGTSHGKQFDFAPLIAALQTHINKYDDWNNEQKKQHWRNVVGGAQRQLPMHAVQEYCRTDRSFKPCPDFSKGARGREFKVRMYYGGTWHDNQVFKRSHWFPAAGAREVWDGYEKLGWARSWGGYAPRSVGAGRDGCWRSYTIAPQLMTYLMYARTSLERWEKVCSRPLICHDSTVLRGNISKFFY